MALRTLVAWFLAALPVLSCMLLLLQRPVVVRCAGGLASLRMHKGGKSTDRATQLVSQPCRPIPLTPQHKSRHP